MFSAEEKDLIQNDVAGYLDRYQDKELLRFVAVGSVDDGKSTLIGRLLHDTGMVYEDQLAAVKSATALDGEEIDFSLITDGLKAEREQGITIDVAYRYFTTDKRKFIIADTPGHIQYTRNMVTGASTANVALILIDARLGVLEQSRRHAYLASLIGIPHLAVCINKMDLVGYDQGTYARIARDFDEFSSALGFKSVTYFPISALKGVNIAKKSDTTEWYDGQSVLEYLESVPVETAFDTEHFRFPVQYVLRPNLNYRGFAGQVVSGSVKAGDEIIVLPSGKKSTVSSIDTYEGAIDEALVPQSVTLRLEDEIDISRGDMICKQDDVALVSRRFQAHLVWMSERQLDPNKSYLIKHSTQSVRAQFRRVEWKKNLETMENIKCETLELNDIGLVELDLHRALYFDDYRHNRATGAFIVIDSLTNNTVAAGMMISDRDRQSFTDALRELQSGSGLKPQTQVSAGERRERMGQSGTTIWLTGLPGSGRWALAYALERKLFDLGRTATVINPVDEDLRSMISAAKACSEAGLVTICAFPSYRQADREALRERLSDRILHVYVNTDPGICRTRRPDADFMAAFDEPERPDATISLDRLELEPAVNFLVELLERRDKLA